MRGDELLDVLEHIDPDLIEQADRKPKAIWLRWTAVAACLALAIGLCALLLPGKAPLDGSTPTVLDMPTGSVTPTLPDPPSAPRELLDLIEHKIYSQPLTGVQVLGSPGFNTNAGVSYEPPEFYFMSNLVVEAKVVRILPDQYWDPMNNSAYHIIQMETVEGLLGKDLPKEFYFRLSVGMSAELGRFDRLILSMSQVGIENYLLYNKTTQTGEVFSLLFEAYNARRPHYGSVIAFTDGVVDMSLWELEDWHVGGSAVEAMRGLTLEDIKDKVPDNTDRIIEIGNLYVRTRANFAASPVYEYVSPFENGIFAHTYDSRLSTVRYCRLINGFMTTEQILVTEDTVTYEGEAFTEEDLKALPDLGALMATLDLDTMSPPHMEYYEQMDVRLRQKGATGKYIKVDGQVYGIVKVTWQFLDNGVYDATCSYYDALYYLVSADGSSRIVERTELEMLVGEDPLILDPEYGTGIWGGA